MAFASIPEILEELKAGKMIVLVDDEDRENEGDLVIPAQTCTPAAINFMIKFGRGVPFIPTTAQRLSELKIPMMTKQNTARHGTAMAETVDALHGTTTGISAFDRAATVHVFIDDAARPEDLARPGHIDPAPRRDRRGARSRGSDRSDRRSLHAGGLEAGGVGLRNHRRRRRDDAPPQLELVLPGTRPQDGHASPT